MIRLLIWLLLIVIIYKIIKTVKKAISNYDKSHENISRRKKNSKYHIKNEDIIEAKFEDIISEDNSKK